MYITENAGTYPDSVASEQGNILSLFPFRIIYVQDNRQSITFFIRFKFDLGPFFGLKAGHIPTDHLSLLTGKQSAVFFSY